MKDFSIKLLLLIIDLLAIVLSIIMAYTLRNLFDNAFFLTIHTFPLVDYLTFYPFYIITLLIFAYEGIYTYRFDFWHESRLVLKGIIFSAILIFAYLAMTKSVGYYSRFTVGLSFIFMAFFIPFAKNISKKLLYRWGLWCKKAKVHGNDPFLSAEIYNNPYLGYIKPKPNEEFTTIFINSKDNTPNELKKILSKQIKEKHEVVFIPLIDDYDLTHSNIYELSNTRTNLIVYQNRLKSKYRRFFQQAYNYLLVVILLPLVLPLIAVIALFIKRESKGPVFFTHYRVGQNGKSIPTYKFRSMYSDAQKRLERLLDEDPQVREEWKNSFKIKEDPRITKVGKFLRKTSLDELPQIFNILRGEMNFVGPRPVLQEEIDNYYKEDAEYYFMVRPGITGLWQVSGRSDTDYAFRVATDKWYVSNWSLWLDIVILFKTIKVVLKMDGAY